jgi:hypothetical protein
MTREQYIEARKTNSIEIMYDYYREHWTEEIQKKHKILLEFKEFVEFIQMYPGIQNAFNVSCEYYDAKFAILKVFLKDNKILFI